MEKVFNVTKVPEDKRVNIRIFYLTGEANIWWKNAEDGLLGPNLTWNRFLKELRAKFHLVVVQW